MKRLPPRPVAVSVRLYRLALWCYPAGFRRRFGPEMALDFADLCRDALERDESTGLVRLWAGTLWDLGRTALRERRAEVKRDMIVCYLAALAMSGAVGWIDLHNDEPQAAALSILVFTFFLGVSKPRSAWQASVLVGLGVWAVAMLASAIDGRPRLSGDTSPHHVAVVLLPVFVGLLGAYAGALARRLFSPSSGEA